jgi:outer membrane protein assembly factor BamB
MRPLLLALVFAVPLTAADWLSASADPRLTRNQPAEKELSRDTVQNLKLLWKLPFNERLTAPVVLGPIFTHRGIKELVFVAGADDNLYAADADLGRLFWTRHFDTPKSDCKTGLTAAPVLAPYNGLAPEGDDASTPRRSLFVLTSDGQLRTVRPADSKDLSLPLPFLPAGSVASELRLTGDRISTYVTGGCAHPGLGEWSRRVTIGDEIREASLADAAPKAAVWQDYRITTKPGGALVITRMTVESVVPLPSSVPPVTANGVVFTVSGTELLAFDIASGEALFKSGPNGSSPAQDSLAIANGHVYFVAGTTLYCYGFPIEI